MVLRTAFPAHHHQARFAQMIDGQIRVPFAHFHFGRRQFLRRVHLQRTAGQQFVLAEHTTGRVDRFEARRTEQRIAADAMAVRLHDGAFRAVRHFGQNKRIRFVGHVFQFEGANRFGWHTRQTVEMRLQFQLAENVADR